MIKETETELRELDAEIERKIFGRCPHPLESILYGSQYCADCKTDFIEIPPKPILYCCPEYHKSWDAVMGLLVPEMERRGWLLFYERFSGNWEGAPLDRPYSFVKFYKGRKPTVIEHYSDGKLAIILCALKAIEAEKKQ